MALTITHDQQYNAKLGHLDHLELSQKATFSQLIFKLLCEKDPTEQQQKLFELILNLSIDHGPDTPSAKKTIEAAENGTSISEAVSEGIEQINDSHGGAIEPLMKVLYEMDEQGISPKALVAKFREADMKLPGYGHRIYKVDPRAQLILDKAYDAGIGKQYINLARELEIELSAQTGKTLPLNIDGAIAAVLCGFGWEPRLGKATFIIARAPGLCAHYLNNAK